MFRLLSVQCQFSTVTKPREMATTSVHSTTKAPAVVQMARAGEGIRQADAFNYARGLSPAAAQDTSGCYAFRCLGCNNATVAYAYVCGGPSLWWGCSTIPFGCLSLPLDFVGPYYLSCKQDGAVVVVDEENKTLACYPGLGPEKQQCCTCYRVGA